MAEIHLLYWVSKERETACSGKKRNGKGERKGERINRKRVRVLVNGKGAGQGKGHGAGKGKWNGKGYGARNKKMER